MTAYLIVYGRDPTDRFAAHRFETRAEAVAASGSAIVPAVPVDGYGRFVETETHRPGVGGCAYVLETEEDAFQLYGPLQIAIYRSLTGNAPDRFESRAVGARRLIEALAEKAIPVTSSNVDDQLTEKTMPDTETTTARGRKPRFDPELKVKVNLDPSADNPLKAGKKNADMLQTVRGLADRNGYTTVGAARSAGVPYGYLQFYAEKGYVTIEGAPVAQAAE